MMQAIGRMALILAAGAFLGLSGARAAPAATNSGKPDGVGKSTETARSSKHRRYSAHHRSSSKTAEKSSDDKVRTDNKTDKNEVAAADNAVPALSDMTPGVANANAQLAAADTPAAAAATAMSARAGDSVQAATDQPAPAPDNPAAAPDQLTDADRVPPQNNAPAQTKVGTAAPATTPDVPPRPAPVMASNSSDGSAWEQSSLIGKVFIGFGALLTLASAARMFMA